MSDVTDDTTPVEESQAPESPAVEPAAQDTEGQQAEETKQPEEQPKDAETPAEPKADEDTQEEKPDDPKEANRQGYAERQRIKAQTQQAVSQQYQPQTAAQLEQQGMDPRDARIEELRQRQEAYEFSTQVGELTANMSMDATSIEQDLDIFNEKSPNFDKAFAEKVSREYIRDAQVQFDDSGQYVLSARIPMYDYYKSRYEDRMAGVKAGQINGQRSAEKMLASAETPSSAAPPDKAPDRLTELWSK